MIPYAVRSYNEGLEKLKKGSVLIYDGNMSCTRN